MANEPAWQAAARSGDKVAAIKAYRLSLGVNLAEAKSAVEEWVSANFPVPPEYEAALRTCERVDERLREYLEVARAGISYTISVAGAPSDSSDLYVLVTSTDSAELDLAVEVAVDGVSTAVTRRLVEDHLASGVRMVWVVETEFPSVTVQTVPEEGRKFFSGAAFTGGDVLPGFSCKVADLFA